MVDGCCVVTLASHVSLPLSLNPAVVDFYPLLSGSQDIPTQVLMAHDGLKVQVLSNLFLRLRVNYLDVFGLVPVEAPRDYLQLIDYISTKDLARLEPTSRGVPEPAPRFCIFGRSVSTGSYFFTFQHDRLFDHQCAANRTVKWILDTCNDELLKDVRLQQRLEAD